MQSADFLGIQGVGAFPFLADLLAIALEFPTLTTHLKL
jgi:hypothetical protein